MAIVIREYNELGGLQCGLGKALDDALKMETSRTVLVVSKKQ
jgi:hypothetical protein